MTENLRLEFDGTSATGLTADDSDVASTYTASNPLIIGATQPYDQPKTGTIDGVAYDRYNWGVASESDMNQSNVDRWLSRSTKKDGVWTTETTPVQSAAASDPTRHQDLTGEDQKTGVYYNWYTATAGTGNWSISTGGVTADSSICPKGWYLPRYDNDANQSWMYLVRNVYHIISAHGDQSTLPDGNPSAIATLHGFPLSLPSSGSVNYQSGATNNQGTNGDFWSAGSASQLNARRLAFVGSVVNPDSGHRRLFGFSVRCIAKQPENQ